WGSVRMASAHTGATRRPTFRRCWYPAPPAAVRAVLILWGRCRVAERPYGWVLLTPAECAMLPPAEIERARRRAAALAAGDPKVIGADLPDGLPGLVDA